MSTEIVTEKAAQFDPQEYSPEGADQPPSETESAILTVLMFGGLVAFAAGCWLMGGFG
ncbi:MAG: hypothetical protein GX596_06085 [Propionibacterium sp.]|nr:hypothetical protein [Propionibacterium sp.]